MSVEIGVPSAVNFIGIGYAAAQGGESGSDVLSELDFANAAAFCFHGVLYSREDSRLMDSAKFELDALAPSKLASAEELVSSMMSATRTSMLYGW